MAANQDGGLMDFKWQLMPPVNMSSLILRHSPFFLFLQLEKLEFDPFSPDLEHEPKVNSPNARIPN
jgi:hypothetical protein